MKPIKKIVINK